VHQWRRVASASLRQGRSEGRVIGGALWSLRVYLDAGLVTWEELAARIRRYKRECED
jgi:hypothetical protein